MIKSVCVYCGSSPGKDPELTRKAQEFGELLAKEKLCLVYGGGNIGMMGAVANAALSGGSEVIGVITEQLTEMEVGHLEVNRLEVVKTMHERKHRMASLADGFIALPGGIGTLEEIFEVLTWTQLGIHTKPCSLYNIAGFYDPLTSMMDHMVESGYVKAAHAKNLIVESDPEKLLTRLYRYEHHTISKLTGETIS